MEASRAVLLLAGALLAYGGLAAASSARGAPQDTGRAIYMGKGFCHGCHGPDARGTPLGPDLTDDVWLHIDGSREQVARVVRSGIPRPKQHPAPMPPMGGGRLNAGEIDAVADYVAGLRP
jgi:mono/diheme cytochrome c family protein